MKKTLLTIITLLAFLATSAQGDKRLKGLEADLNAILEVTHAAGFAVAVVEGDKVVYAKGFGYRDYENKVPADANTLFAIGSSSKAFTSAILGQLRDEDKLSFDDSPIQYVPELSFFNEEMNNQIKIKDLMCHRTGLPRHDFSWYLFPTFDKDSLVARIEFQEPFTGVREQWFYNNFMFLTQGVIAERITGKSWEDNIKERFFQPLGMSRSNVSITELEQSSNVALGYGLKDDTVINKMAYYHIAAMSPAGSINSSVNDMTHWVSTWIHNGKFKGEQILPETYVNEAMSSQMVVGGGLPDKEFPDMHMSNYGYGWFVSSYRGHYRVEHGGNIDGFSANVAFFPADSLGIIVLANQNGSAVPNLVRNTVADRMLKTTKTDWAKRYKEQRIKAKKMQVENVAATSSVANTRPSHILQDYTGKYSHPGYGNFVLQLKNDSLFAAFSKKRFYVSHYHYDIFELLEVTEEGVDTTGFGNVKINFETNESGDISLAKIKFEPTVDPLEFSRTPTSMEVKKETLERYVGEYMLGETTIKIYTKNDETLFLFVAGQPEYELLATGKHKFSFKALEGFKVEFVESEGNAIDDMTLIQPNGTFKTKRKK